MLNRAMKWLTTVVLVTASTMAAAQTPQNARYQVNPIVGTVFDGMTKLTWQRDVNAIPAMSRIDASRYCASLALAGKRWRLPTVVELWSLVDLGHVSPMIDPVAFADTPAENFWSSSTHLGSRDLAWSVGFDAGSKHGHRMDLTIRVRCVR